MSAIAQASHGITASAAWVLEFSQCDSLIAGASSAFMAPGTGGKENEFMNERIKYSYEPLGDLKVVPDFLPRPQDLVFREEGVKVTISLSPAEGTMNGAV